jgi:hypothetical protein
MEVSELANADKPFGLRPAYTSHGGPPRITKYKNTAVAIYPGDLVHKDGSGRVNTIASTETPMGVAVNYVSATADQAIYVYDDLANTFFRVQGDGTDLANDTVRMNFFDPICSTGNTTTLQGKMELDTDASAEDTLILIDKVHNPMNAWGGNVELIVKVRADTQAQVIAVT